MLIFAAITGAAVIGLLVHIALSLTAIYNVLNERLPGD